MQTFYSIKNLRRILDSPDIELKPITILVGRNSAGKSTYLRTFPLLKQSLATRSSAPVLWFGDYVDFGDFTTSVSHNDTKKNINFSFKFKNVDKDIRVSTRPFRRVIGLQVPQLNIDYQVGLRGEKTVIHSISVQMENENINAKIITNPRDGEGRFEIDGDDFLIGKKESLVASESNLFTSPKFILEMKVSGEIRRRILGGLTFFEGELRKHLQQIMPKNIGYETLSREARRITSTKKPDKQKFKEWSITASTMAFRKLYKRFSEEAVSDDLEVILIYRKAFMTFVALEFAENELTGLFENVKYLGPARARSERYYRKQELEVSEISPDGQNFPMFLSSLSKQRVFEFSKWVEDIFGYGVQLKASPGHTSILLTSGDEKVNVTDTGYGVSQLLPVLGQIWWATIQNNRRAPSNLWRKSSTPTLTIEQPELHLHPAHQGLLADVFVKATKVSSTQKIRLIVETHSEALINRLGELIQNEVIAAEDVQIVVFGASSKMNSPSEISIAKFDKEGVIHNWPFGFFDFK